MSASPCKRGLTRAEHLALARDLARRDNIVRDIWYAIRPYSRAKVTDAYLRAQNYCDILRHTLDGGRITDVDYFSRDIEQPHFRDVIMCPTRPWLQDAECGRRCCIPRIAPLSVHALVGQQLKEAIDYFRKLHIRLCGVYGKTSDQAKAANKLVRAMGAWRSRLDDSACEDHPRVADHEVLSLYYGDLSTLLPSDSESDGAA